MTLADADLVGSATLVAVTENVVVLETVGAVKRPAVEIVPPLAVHLTAVLVLPVTASVNCLLPPELTVVVVGEMVTETVCCCALTVTVFDVDAVSPRLSVTVSLTV